MSFTFEQPVLDPTGPSDQEIARLVNIAGNEKLRKARQERRFEEQIRIELSVKQTDDKQQVQWHQLRHDTPEAESLRDGYAALDEVSEAVIRNMGARGETDYVLLVKLKKPS